MKLIHHLVDGPYPRCQPDVALRELFEWGGLAAVSGIENQLAVLRRLQNGEEMQPHACEGGTG